MTGHDHSQEPICRGQTRGLSGVALLVVVALALSSSVGGFAAATVLPSLEATTERAPAPTVHKAVHRSTKRTSEEVPAQRSRAWPTVLVRADEARGHETLERPARLLREALLSLPPPVC